MIGRPIDAERALTNPAIDRGLYAELHADHVSESFERRAARSRAFHVATGGALSAIAILSTMEHRDVPPE
jgi:hypothetical protein